MSQKTVSKADQARQASEALDSSSVIAVGSYTLNYAGGSKRLTPAEEFCRHNGIGKGDEVDEWIDYETGALIILPKNNER